jgi:hypothetical protein
VLERLQIAADFRWNFSESGTSASSESASIDLRLNLFERPRRLKVERLLGRDIEESDYDA